eukprot:817143_1
MPSLQVCINRVVMSAIEWWRYDSLFIWLSFHQTYTSVHIYNDFAERNTDSCSDYAMDAAVSLYWFGFCVTIQYASNTHTSSPRFTFNTPFQSVDTSSNPSLPPPNLGHANTDVNCESIACIA